MATLALRPLRTASPMMRRASLASCRAVSRSCDGPRPPPRPACTPAEQPACRPRPSPAVQRGVRVVCCAPPQGARPPCAVPARAPPLTCADRTGLSRKSRCVRDFEDGNSGRCGRGQDRVARRLECARAARRAEYEREAAERAPPPPAVLAPYTLGEDRVCSRATDGREYQLPCAPDPPPRCGSGRVPPAPQCVSLRPDAACRVSDGRPDPCAHRPRVFVDIDRGSPPSAATPAPASPPEQRSLTSRIMDGLGRARRPAGPGGCAGEGSRRRLHTKAIKEQVASGLAGVLRAREGLAAAGRGRVAVRCETEETTRAAPVTGRLELPVPRGADRVSVKVSLAAARAVIPPACEPPTPTRGTAAPCGSGGPWLSLKTIQKRFASCRRDDAAARSSAAAGACGPPAGVRPPCGPPPPCSPPTGAPPPCGPPPLCGPPSGAPPSLSPKEQSSPCVYKTPTKTRPCADKAPPRGSENKPIRPQYKKCFTAAKFLNELILLKT